MTISRRSSLNNGQHRKMHGSASHHTVSMKMAITIERAMSPIEQPRRRSGPVCKNKLRTFCRPTMAPPTKVESTNGIGIMMSRCVRTSSV